MENKKTQTQTGNITINKTEHKENFVILSTYHLQDKRLKPIEQHILTRLLILPNNWRITKKNTSKFFGLSIPTFTKIINSLIKYGYIEITKLNRNAEIYTIKEISDYQINFNIYNLKNYTNGQLNYFLKNDATPSKYKKVIKFYIDKNQEIDNLIKELELEEDNKPF